MARGKPWSTEEDKVLIDQVSLSANNLSKAFRETSKILENRTVNACRDRWVKHLSKGKPCFATIGKKTRNINRKNVHQRTSDNTEKTTVSIWNKFLRLFNSKKK